MVLVCLYEMCLLIGPPGVGKTVLLKRLHSCSNRGIYSDVGDLPATFSTVGINLLNVLVGRRNEVTVRELGGSLAPVWHKYYSNCNALMFVIDMSNRTQVSAACIQLMDVVCHEKLHNVPMLVILNKLDMPNAMTSIEFNPIFRLSEIVANAKQKITVLETSGKDGHGLAEVAQWIKEHFD